jgi:DNA helicase-2/ATP-dependent DNA helicase PcrA
MTEELNDEQLAAVNSLAYTTIVPAGPGSGKSRTLAARIKLALARGADPRELVAFTFTNSGARVLQERIGTALNYIGTIHGFGMRLIQRNGSLIGYQPDVKLANDVLAKEFLLEARKRIRPKINDRQLLEPLEADPPTVKADVDLIWRESVKYDRF